MKNKSLLNVGILGSGSFVPPYVVTNKDLELFYPLGSFPQYGSPFDWSANWIEEKLGIKERRFAYDMKESKMRDGLYDLDFAEKSSRLALEDAGLKIEDIESIIYISSTPEYFMPDPACLLHLRLGARDDTSAFGLTSVGCGGFVYGMINASSMIESGMAQNVLIVASNSVSSYMSQYEDPNLSKEQIDGLKIRDRLNASMFGDGSGAMVLGKQNTNNESYYYWGADGSHNPVIFEAGGSRNPTTIETVKNGKHFFNMDGRVVKDYGPALFEKTISNILKQANTDISQIDFFILHQVNFKLLKKIAEDMKIPLDKMAIHVDVYGNLDTATLGVGYDESKKADKIKKGDKVMFAAVGAGWQYGGLIMTI